MPHVKSRAKKALSWRPGAGYQLRDEHLNRRSGRRFPHEIIGSTVELVCSVAATLVCVYRRTLDLRKLAERKALFLFGPRSTGKTTLIRAQFDARAIVNLLRSSEYLPLAESPSRLREVVAEGRVDTASERPVIVIDEIQRLPQLLDQVHDLIETERIHFVLSGSSGRKLKRSGVNLLGGRAWQANLFPLAREIPDLDLGRYLLYGDCPRCMTPSFQRRSYTHRSIPI